MSEIKRDKGMFSRSKKKAKKSTRIRHSEDADINVGKSKKRRKKQTNIASYTGAANTQPVEVQETVKREPTGPSLSAQIHKEQTRVEKLISNYYEKGLTWAEPDFGLDALLPNSGEITERALERWKELKGDNIRKYFGYIDLETGEVIPVPSDRFEYGKLKEKIAKQKVIKGYVDEGIIIYNNIMEILQGYQPNMYGKFGDNVADRGSMIEILVDAFDNMIKEDRISAFTFIKMHPELYEMAEIVAYSSDPNEVMSSMTAMMTLLNNGPLTYADKLDLSSGFYFDDLESDSLWYYPE